MFGSYFHFAPHEVQGELLTPVVEPPPHYLRRKATNEFILIRLIFLLVLWQNCRLLEQACLGFVFQSILPQPVRHFRRSLLYKVSKYFANSDCSVPIHVACPVFLYLGGLCNLRDTSCISWNLWSPAIRHPPFLDGPTDLLRFANRRLLIFSKSVFKATDLLAPQYRGCFFSLPAAAALCTSSPALV